MLYDDVQGGSNDVFDLYFNDTSSRKLFKFSRPLNATDMYDTNVTRQTELYFITFASDTGAPMEMYSEVFAFDGRCW